MSHQTTPAPNDLITSHMSTIQGLISRFAGNSANCKNMCLTLVSAILALLSANKDPQTFKIAYSVLFLMAWMDAYYLGKERTAVDLSKDAAKKIQTGVFTYEDVYKFTLGDRGWKPIWNAFKAMLSHSIWPFYGGLLVCLLVMQWYFAFLPE